MAEVGGDAVWYADSPADTDLASALGRLLDDDALRGELGRAAVARSAGYTWDAAAIAHRDLFLQVAGR